MKAIITGGAGFIGSHMVDKLINQGDQVTIIDNLSSGKIENIKQWLNSPMLNFVKADLKEPANWIEHFKDIDVMYHFAANPEVQVSFTNPEIHYRENLESTFNVLEACRKKKVQLIVFPSTSTVYGEPKIMPTPETYSPLEPISIYGSVKLACEILLQTYTKLYPIRALVLRYANIMGTRSRHGVLFDFISKLKANKKQLEVLGDGTQRKSYLYLEDVVDATIAAQETFERRNGLYDLYNVGSEDQVDVREIANIVVEEMGLKNVEYVFRSTAKDGRGWPGDVKTMLLDISKIKTETGWKPKYNSEQVVRKSVEKLLMVFD